MHKVGPRRTKKGMVQRYRCQNCGRYSSSTLHPYSLYPDEIIFRSLELYNTGLTLETISTILQNEFNKKPPARTIYSWLERYEKYFSLFILRGERNDNGPGPIREVTVKTNPTSILKYHIVKLNMFGRENPNLKPILEMILKGDITIATYNNGDSLNDIQCRDLRFEQVKEGIAKTLKLIQRGRDSYRMDGLKDMILLIDRNCIAIDIPLADINDFNDWNGNIDLLLINNKRVELILFIDDERTPSDLLPLSVIVKDRFRSYYGLPSEEVSVSILKNGTIFRVLRY